MCSKFTKGAVFGKWTILEDSFLKQTKPGRNVRYAKSQCECGTIKDVTVDSIRSGTSRSCSKCRPRTGRPKGSGRGPRNDVTGEKFGKWTILSIDHVDYSKGSGVYFYLCRCECGNEKVVRYTNLKGGNSTQCLDCRDKSYLDNGNPNYKDGSRTIVPKSPTASTYSAMIRRCTYAFDMNFKNYGAKGVRVCERWAKSFNDFISDMGEKPDPSFTIDRKNKDESTKHYSCGKCDECRRNGWVFHCRWSTMEEQANNRSNCRYITYQGETLTATQWSRKLGIKYQTIIMRLNKGLEPSLVLATDDLRKRND